MSTRSATIITTTAPWYGEQREVARFYRHCDGYPEGHGAQMAKALGTVENDGYWVADFIRELVGSYNRLEFEPKGFEHGDIEFLYLVSGHSGGGTEAPTITVYAVDWDEDYAHAMNGEPLFSGTAEEYLQRFKLAF